MITKVTFMVSTSVFMLLLTLIHTDKLYQPNGDTYLKYFSEIWFLLMIFPVPALSRRGLNGWLLL